MKKLIIAASILLISTAAWAESVDEWAARISAEEKAAYEKQRDFDDAHEEGMAAGMAAAHDAAMFAAMERDSQQ